MVKVKQPKAEKPQKLKKKVSINVAEVTPIKAKKSIIRQKTPKVTKKTIEPPLVETPNKYEYFDVYEDKYDISCADIEKAIKGVCKFASENPKLQNQLFAERVPLFLQIACVKIPKGGTKILRIPLKNSILTEEDDVCIIVGDVKGLPNKEHDQHLEHYEKLFEAKGLKFKKIMTFHEFRTEYETFEQRNRLVDLYDYFLADGKICGKVVKKCGKIFYRKRKVPTPVKLQATNLQQHIGLSFHKTQFQLTGHGDCFTVQFGHSKMPMLQLVQNVWSLVVGLDKLFPGGVDNLRSINVYTHRATSIPIYLNLRTPNGVDVPNIELQESKAPKKVIGEVTTVTGQVLVQRDGLVKVIQPKKPAKNIAEDVENGDAKPVKKLVKNVAKVEQNGGAKPAKKLLKNVGKVTKHGGAKPAKKLVKIVAKVEENGDAKPAKKLAKNVGKVTENGGAKPAKELVKNVGKVTKNGGAKPVKIEKLPGKQKNKVLKGKITKQKANNAQKVVPKKKVLKKKTK